MENLEIIKWIAEVVIIPGVAWVVGYVLGKRKKDNDFLAELQQSIDLLSSKNKTLVEEIVNLNDKVVSLTQERGDLKNEVAALRDSIVRRDEKIEEQRKEIAELKEAVDALTEKLDGVKTITRIKKND